MDLSPATAVTSLEHGTWLRHAECGQNWRATAVTSDERNQDSGEQPRQRDRAVWALLSEHSPGQPWWLGYLDTGVDDMVFPGAPMVTLYAGWHYVLVEAGPEQAATWRRNDPVSYGALPNLMFPPTDGSFPRCGTTTGVASADTPDSWADSCATLTSRPGRSGPAKTPRHQVTRRCDASGMRRRAICPPAVCHEHQSILICAPELVIPVEPQAAPNGGYMLVADLSVLHAAWRSSTAGGCSGALWPALRLCGSGPICTARRR
jgi:hypothetical protein